MVVVGVEPQGPREDRVEEEENRGATVASDEVGDRAHRLAPHLRHDDIGLGLVEDPLEGDEVPHRPLDAPSLRAPGADRIGAVHVPERGDGVTALDPGQLRVDIDVSRCGKKVRKAVGLEPRRT